MSTIDFRVRPNTDIFMKFYAGDAWARHWEMFGRPAPEAEPLEDHIATLDRLGIDKIVCTGRQRVRDGSIGDTVSNDYVAECAQRFPDRIIGFAGIDPTAGMAAVHELRRSVRDLGLRGVAIDVRQPQRRPDDGQYYLIYGAAVDLGIPVVLTLGPLAGRFGDLDAVDRLSEDFPELTVVLSHGLWPYTQEAIGLAWRRRNVYIETSVYPFYPGADMLWEAADTIISDRVIYASGFPFDSLETVERVRALPLRPENLRKVLFDNAATILGLS